MDQYENLAGGTSFIEFDLNGKKVKISIKAHHHFQNAIKLLGRKKLMESNQEIDRCIEAEPENEYSYYYKGYILEQFPNYKNAITVYQKSLQFDPSQYWISFRLGLCYQYLKEFEESIKYFTNSLKDFEDFSDPIINYNLRIEQIFNNRAISYTNLGKSQQSIDDCTMAINSNPQYANSYFVRGMEYIRLKNMHSAEIDIRKAASLNFPKANEILLEYFPDKEESVFEKTKTFAESEQALKNSGGQRPSELFRKDIIRYLQANELYSYYDLLNFCNNFLDEFYSKYKLSGINLNQSNKAYIIYELTVAICKIYKSTDQKELFNKLYEE